MQFAGFTEADFDAYLPARATSNAFNRPRVEVKQKALSLARSLGEAAATAGLGLEVRASDEVPSLWNKRSVTSQWVFFWRDQSARKRLEELLDKGRTLAATLTDPTPFFRHAFLALYLDSVEIEVALKVHGDAWVDVRNLRALLSDGARRDELLSALRALPADFVMGVTGHDSVPARDVDGAALSATFDALTDASQWWFLGRKRPRAEAVAAGSSLGEWVEETFRALLPIYRIAAWSHDNDLVSIEAELEAARAERLAHVSSEAAREAEWQAQHLAEIERRRETAEAETRERLARSERPRPAVVQFAVQHITSESVRPPQRASTPPRPSVRVETAPAPVASKPPPPQHPEAELRERLSKAPKPRSVLPPVETASPVVVGAKVKVKSGPFAERIGTVAEVDAKGHARVLFGLIAARLEVGELVTVSDR